MRFLLWAFATSTVPNSQAQVKVEEQLKSTIGLYNDSTAVQTGWDKLQEQVR